MRDSRTFSEDVIPRRGLPAARKATQSIKQYNIDARVTIKQGPLDEGVLIPVFRSHVESILQEWL